MQKHLCLVALAALMAVSSAGAATFASGKSYYGVQAQAAQAGRTIDLAQARDIRVVCGEAVTFVNKGQQFSWKFGSIHHSRVPLARFAPGRFDTAGKAVYIQRSEHEMAS